jgi:hypothetical protein
MNISTQSLKKKTLYVVRAYYKLGLIHCWGWRESEEGRGEIKTNFKIQNSEGNNV